MSFPFAKTNCYLHSTRTPWIVRWPNRIRPNSVDKEHLISGVDFMPTVLEATGVELPEGMDGTSLLPVLFGDPQHRKEADRLRGQLLEWMRETGDPTLAAFEGRHSPAALERFMARYRTKAVKEIKALKEYEQQTGYRF